MPGDVQPNSEDRLSHIADALQSRIDAAGFGMFQVLMLALTGGVMFAEGSEMLVMGSITTLLHDQWDLNPFIRGLMVSIVFVGFAAGNIISGLIGDRVGRRPAVLLSYLLIGCFGVATATARSKWVMVLLRFCVGVGCGIGFPAVYSLIPEVCPTNWRGSVSSMMIGFMPLGELCAAIVLWYVDPNLQHTTDHCELGYDINIPHHHCSWRHLCVYSAMPAFLFLLVAIYLLFESPHFLAAKNRPDGVDTVLEHMELYNCAFPGRRPLLSPSGAQAQAAAATLPQNSGSSGAWRTMRSPRYLWTTVFMCACHVTKDFTVFGLSYVFPQFFLRQEGTVAVHLMTTAVTALPGVLIAVVLMRVNCIGHINSLRMMAALAATAAIGMLDFTPVFMKVPCAYLLKFLSLAYFIVTVIYTSEVFPAKFRNTAVGTCTAVGRMGSIAAPLIFEMSLSASGGSFDFFLGIVIVLMITVAATAGCCLSIETKGRALALDISDEDDYGSTGPSLSKSFSKTGAY